MDLRITSQTNLNDALSAVDRQTTLLGKLQQQASSGKKILMPSDDPQDMGVLMSNKSENSRLDMYLSGIANTQATLNQSVSTLQDASGIMTSAHSLALEAAQTTNSTEGLTAMAQQVEQLLERLIGDANTQQNGAYLYAGASNRTPPFVITSTNAQGQPQTVAYQGATQRGGVPVAPGNVVDTLYSGQEIFQKTARAATVYTGSTGAAAGGGTDSATGEGTLLVQHTNTTYAPGSGIQPGTSSAQYDTVLGPAGAHTLTIIDSSGTGSAGTISLDGGPPVNFTNADTNLQVAGPNGTYVYVDTTALTRGFSGTIAITADGTLSTDGGNTTTPIAFSANQVVTDGTTGKVTNVDSTQIRAVGSDDLKYTGTLDAFQALISLRDKLQNAGANPSPAQLTDISNLADDITRAQNGILNVVGKQSANLQNLDDMENAAKNAQLTNTQVISNLEDADISQLVIQLQALQNQMQLTFSSTSRVMSQTLLDFLPVV